MTHTERKRKTIERYSKLDWTKPDAQLAKDIGRSRAMISFMRHRLGYPPSKRSAILSELRAASLGHRRGPATRKTKTVISADRKHMSRIGRKKGKN